MRLGASPLSKALLFACMLATSIAEAQQDLDAGVAIESADASIAAAEDAAAIDHADADPLPPEESPEIAPEPEPTPELEPDPAAGWAGGVEPV